MVKTNSFNKRDLEKKKDIFFKLDANIIDKKLDSIYLVKEGQKLLKNQRELPILPTHSMLMWIFIV